MMLDWNTLKTFVEIADHGTLQAASKRLRVNHSTVYRRLQKLQEETGIQLVRFDANRYSLTPAGEELAAIGREIRAKYDDVERFIVGKEHQPRGQVRITAPPNIANRFLPEALETLRHRYPDIIVEVMSDNQNVNLNSRIADIAIRATTSPPEHLIGRKVVAFPWAAYASEQFARRAAALVQPDELETLNLIGGTDDMLLLPAFSWLEKRFAHRMVVRCDDLTTMACFAQKGYGVALLPMDQECEGLVKLMTLDHITPSEIWILHHPDFRGTERINVVVKHLVDYFTAHDPA